MHLFIGELHTTFLNALVSLEERSIRPGAAVHGRQEKEKRRQKEKGSLSEGELVSSC